MSWRGVRSLRSTASLPTTTRGMLGYFAAAAISAGLPADLAARLARETVAGSGELLKQSSIDAATLRKNVTSPGGTTAAALDVLMGPGGVETLLTTAVAMAARRSRELAD